MAAFDFQQSEVVLGQTDHGPVLGCYSTGVQVELNDHFVVALAVAGVAAAAAAAEQGL